MSDNELFFCGPDGETAAVFFWDENSLSFITDPADYYSRWAYFDLDEARQLLEFLKKKIED
jgi:hypothetical protein